MVWLRLRGFVACGVAWALYLPDRKLDRLEYETYRSSEVSASMALA